jgi:hypothetical protein
MSSESVGTSSAYPPLPPPAPLPARPRKNPAGAVLLSLFPGLGQIYNGQLAKALTFFFAWVGSIYMTAEGHPMPFGFLIPFVYLYNLVDAYRSACGINEGRGPSIDEGGAESPAWGATLVFFGVIILFNNLGWLNLAALARYWPVLLIAAGVALLYGSLRRRAEAGPGPSGDAPTGF